MAKKSDTINLTVVDDISDEGHGDLYKASIADKHVQKPELIDNDVDRVIVAGNALLYYKNCDEPSRLPFLHRDMIRRFR